MNRAHTLIVIHENLLLRQLKLSEADEIFELVDKNRDYLRPWLPWVDHTTSVADSEAFIRSVARDCKRSKSYGFGIFYEGTLVGHMSILDAQTDEPKIGYWITRDVAGQGITSSAVTALTNYAFKMLNLSRIIIHADVRNMASNRVAEKCGYTLQHTKILHGDNMNIWVKNPL